MKSSYASVKGPAVSQPDYTRPAFQCSHGFVVPESAFTHSTDQDEIS